MSTSTLPILLSSMKHHSSTNTKEPMSRHMRTLVESLLMKMVGSAKISTMKLTLLANSFLCSPTKLKRLVENLRHMCNHFIIIVHNLIMIAEKLAFIRIT